MTVSRRAKSKRTTRTSAVTQAERVAYNQGKAFGAAKAGGRVNLRMKKEKESFKRGVKAAKASLRTRKTKSGVRRRK